MRLAAPTSTANSRKEVIKVSDDHVDQILQACDKSFVDLHRAICELLDELRCRGADADELSKTRKHICARITTSLYATPCGQLPNFSAECLPDWAIERLRPNSSAVPHR